MTEYVVYIESFERRWGLNDYRTYDHKKYGYMHKPLKSSSPKVELRSFLFLDKDDPLSDQPLKTAVADGFKFTVEYIHRCMCMTVASPVAGDDERILAVIECARGSRIFKEALIHELAYGRGGWRCQSTGYRLLAAVPKTATTFVVKDPNVTKEYIDSYTGEKETYTTKIDYDHFDVNIGDEGEGVHLTDSLLGRMTRSAKRAITAVFNVPEKKVYGHFESPHTHIMHEYYGTRTSITGMIPIGYDINAVTKMIREIIERYPRDDLDPISNDNQVLCCGVYPISNDWGCKCPCGEDCKCGASYSEHDEIHTSILRDKAKTIRSVSIDRSSSIPKTMEALLNLRTVVHINLENATGLTLDYIDKLARLPTLELLVLTDSDPLIVGRALSILGDKKCVYCHHYRGLAKENKTPPHLIAAAYRAYEYEEHVKNRKNHFNH